VTAVADAPAMPSYDLLEDLGEIRERVQAVIAEKKPFGFDVETAYLGDSREGASLHPEENFLVSWQFTNSLNWARMIPLAFESGRNVDNKAVAPLLWEMLHAVDDEGLPLGVAHGAVAELRWAARWFLRHLWDHPLFGRQVRASHGYYPVRSCTMLESFSEGKNQSHALKAMTLANYGHQMRELTEGSESLLGRLLGRAPTEKEKNCVRFNVFNPADPEVIAYACEDAVWCLRHHLDRWPSVKDTFIYKVEMQVLPLVCSMSDIGIQYDWALLRAKAAEITEFTERLLAEIIADFEEMIGEALPPSFNFNSSKQFGDLLYVRCGMPVLHRTPGGKPSVDAKNALPGLAKDYPVVAKYMGWKRLTDLRDKFVGTYERDYLWAADGRAHPTLNQHGTIAGRFSCESPNYQQSPGEYHYELRDGTRFDFNFRDSIIATRPGTRNWWDVVLEEAGCPDIPEPEPLGWYIIGFDYSQIELRVMAAEAGETALLQAFASGQDVHARTAALMLGIDISQVTKELRKKGKAQPTYEQVLTPQGWRRMDSLRVGSQVIGSDGRPTRVTGVFPQGVKDVYEVRFSDGAVVRCCDEHYWTVSSKVWSQPKTLQLSEIRRSLKWARPLGGEYRYWVGEVAPVEMAPEDLPVDPYLLGLLLGDGSFRGRSVMLTTADAELVEAARTALEPLGLLVKPKDRYDYYVTGYGRRGAGRPSPLMAFLRGAGLLGLKSCQKFVPPAYLRGRSSDRLALLQGLMDTDGCLTSRAAEFSTTSEHLADDVVALVRSLGGTARKSPHQHGTAWRVYIRMRELSLFRLKRKADLYRPSGRPLRRKIVEVVPVTPCRVQCISVEASDGLYVTRDYVLTHNTRNFASVYGQGIGALADQLGISIEDARELDAQYNAAYPHMKPCRMRVIGRARRDGYIITKFGRRVTLHRIRDENPKIRAKEEMTAGNAFVQGPATGDYVKVAMVRAQRALDKAGLSDRVRLVMNVHDALEFEVRQDVAPIDVIRVLQPAVVYPVTGPGAAWPEMVAEWHLGRSWGSVKDIHTEGDQIVVGKLDECERCRVEPAPVEVPVRVAASLPEPPVPAEPSGPPRDVSVVLGWVPTRGQVNAFAAFAKSLPGRNSVELQMPGSDGEQHIRAGFTCGLTPAHEARVSVLLGSPVMMHYDVDSVDTEALTSDLEL
jgi:DNA polymerase I-like protein with 3'-5' exonuclease and polymerase domains